MPALAASAESRPTRVTTVVHADVKTGRLVRSVAVKSLSPARQVATAPLPASGSVDSLIDRIAAQEGVEAPLVHSVIQAESNYNAAAVSPKGALGMMQLIPSTARRFGVSDAFNVTENVQGGVRYLRFLLDHYKNDYVRAIAAYNAGEGAVDKYDGIPPFAETRSYVVTVARNLTSARSRHQEPVPANASPAKPAAGTVIEYTGTDGRTYYKTP